MRGAVRIRADTPVWSAALRRSAGTPNPDRAELLKLVGRSLIAIIGPIRPEILPGIKDPAKSEAVRDPLRTFPDREIETSDYEGAAAFHHRGRSAGVQGSVTDFVLGAVAVRHQLAIFADDRDFHGFRRVRPIRFYALETQP